MRNQYTDVSAKCHGIVVLQILQYGRAKRIVMVLSCGTWNLIRHDQASKFAVLFVMTDDLKSLSFLLHGKVQENHYRQTANKKKINDDEF